MATYHTVKQGEYLPKIAMEYGFANYQKIWDHPENAELKEKRQTPNVLFPGDRLYIPDKQVKTESGATGQRHRFRLKGELPMLRIVLKDVDDQPIANAECDLVVEGKIHQVTTDANGLIEQEIPKTAEGGYLLSHDPEIPFDSQIPIEIQIGHLDPVEEISGQRARLNNLGYDTGDPDSGDEQQFRSAVEEFQCDYGLTVNGVCDPETQEKLKEVYGC